MSSGTAFDDSSKRREDFEGSEIEEDVTKLWTKCLSKEFPITSVANIDGATICYIGMPYPDYTIKTSQKNGQLNGEARLYNSEGRIIAIFTYQQGKMNGRCKLYTNSGRLFFYGFLKEGYRNGLGVEYSADGRKIVKGYFKDGTFSKNIQKRSDNPQYWEEKEDKICSLFKVDENYLYHGVCYFFENGNIDHISRWFHGKEIEPLQSFNNDIMTIYKNGVEIYTGRYQKKSDYSYVPLSVSLPNSKGPMITGYEEAKTKKDFLQSILLLSVSTVVVISLVDLFIYCLLVFFATDTTVERTMWMFFVFTGIIGALILCIISILTYKGIKYIRKKYHI